MFRIRQISSSLSVFLLIIFLFNIGGYLVFFFIQLHQIRTEAINKIQCGMESEELVRISVDKNTSSDLIWIEDHEFRFEDQIYDIVYAERSTTNTVYYCYSDSKETELYALLSRVIKRMRNRRKNGTVKIIKVFRYNYEISINPPSEFFQNHKKIADTYSLIYKSLSSQVSVPPPKLS